MTLYQVIQKINDSLGARDNEVFNHLIWETTDNGGFLRTQYCKRKAALQDKELGIVKYAVLGLQSHFNHNDFAFTSAKVQMFWCDSDLKLEEALEINNNLGYTYNITISIGEEEAWKQRNF